MDLAFPPGTPVRIRGYKPATVVTGRVRVTDGCVLIDFGNDCRQWHHPSRMKATSRIRP